MTHRLLNLGSAGEIIYLITSGCSALGVVEYLALFKQGLLIVTS